MARKKNYINNKDMYNALCDYLNKYSECIEQQKETPRIPDYIGQAFYLLSERIGRKQNFSRYSYLDEMKGDGIENCIMQIRSFNPQKSNNPFAYFSTIIHNAFIRRIKREKQQQYIKIKNLDNLCIIDEIAGIQNSKTAYNEITDAYVKSFEEKKAKKPVKKKTKSKLAALIEIENENEQPEKEPITADGSKFN